MTISNGTGSFADANVGTNKTVTASGFGLTGADAGDYTLSSQPSALSANITAAGLTVTTKNVTMTYADGTTLNGTTGFTTSGLLGSDSVSSVTLGTNATTSGSGNWNAGTWTITSSAALGSGLSNYSITYATGTQTINAKPVSISGVVATNKVYDSTTADTLNTGSESITGKVTGDNVNIGNGTGAFSDANVGTNKTVTASGFGLTGADAGDYTLSSQPSALSANITAAGLTVTAKNVTMTYADGTTLNGTTGFTTSGLLGSDSVSSVSLATNATTSGSGNWNAGTWTIASSAALGSGLSNYSITYATGTQTINAKSVSISGVAATNKVYDSTTTDTLNTGSESITGKVTGDNVTISNGTGAFSDANVGTNKTVTASGFSLAGADAGDYSLSGQPAAMTANITAASLTITGKNVSGTYGSVSLNGATGFTETGLLGSDAVSSVTLGTNATTSTSGNYNVSGGTPWTITPSAAQGTGLSNYSITYNNAATGLTINPLAITVASGVTANNKVYDATTNATLAFSTPSLSGVIGSDVVSVNQSTGGGSFADANVANNKAVTVSGLGLTGHDAADYTLTQPSGLTANITPASLTVTADSKSKHYGDTDPALTYTTAGLQGTDTAAGVLSGSLTRNSGENVGTYTINQGTLASNSNYTLSYVSGSLTITTANILAVAANNQTMIYGGSLPTLTYTYSGLVNGDTSSVFSGALATAATSSSNVGAYAITLGTLSAGSNYAINYTGGTLTINKATLNVTASSGQSKVYGTSDPTLAYGYSGLVNGDTSSVFSGAQSRVAGENVGNYAIGQGTLSAGGNYSINYTGANFAVNPASLILTAKNVNMTYADGTTLNGVTGFTESGLVSGDSVGSVTLTTNATTSSSGNWNAGSWAITPSAASGTGLGNYSITYAAGTQTINARSVSIGGVAATGRIYDATTADTLNTGSESITGKVTGDNLTVTNGTGAFITANAGNGIAVTASGFGLGGADAGDYILSGQPSGLSANITPATLTVTASSGQHKTYGTSDPVLTYAYNGLQGADSSSVFSGSLIRAAGENAGTYAIGQGSLSAGSNYAISYNAASFIINPAALTVTANDAGKIYGAAMPGLTYTYSGLTNGDTASVFTGGLASAGTASSNVGSYAITQGSVSAGSNYTISFTPGQLTINQAALIITADDKSMIYGAARRGFTASYTGLVNGDSSAVVSGLRFNAPGTNAGSYTITPYGASAGNYAISYAGGTLIIDPAVLTAAADSKHRTQGGANPPLTFSYAGLANGDTDSVFSGALATPADGNSATGSYAITQGTLLAGTNYLIDFTPGALTVTAAPQTSLPSSVISTLGQTTNYVNPTLIMEKEFIEPLTIYYLGNTQSLVSVAPSAGLTSARDADHFAITPSSVITCNGDAHGMDVICAPSSAAGNGK